MPRPQSSETLLIALGGNALIRKGQVGTIREQFENLKAPIRQSADAGFSVSLFDLKVWLCCYLFCLAQLSFKPTVRLNTSLPGRLS